MTNTFRHLKKKAQKLRKKARKRDNSNFGRPVKDGRFFFKVMIKKSCGCRGLSLTKDNWNDFLFYELTVANKYQKRRVIVRYNNNLTTMNEGLAESLGLKILGLIIPGTTNINNIEIYEGPF